MKKLKIHPDGRYLMWDDGKPFFYMGDTAWAMFEKLDRDEIQYYLDIRAGQGFNVIQACALFGHKGLDEPNAYGRMPLKKNGDSYDPTMPDEGNGYDYWQHVDYAVEYAAHKGLFIALLPTWGDKFNKLWGEGPEIFTPENAYIYGKWIGRRYRKNWNIIWMLGGDRPLETETHIAIVDAMGKGIREGDGGTHLITYHPSGGWSSTDFLKGKPYLDFHTVQSGHRATATFYSWKLVRKAGKEGEKPFMDSEPRYEGIPAAFGEDDYLWNSDDIRQNAYWNLMEGVCGHTYGNNAVWAFNTEKSDFFQQRWYEVIKSPGAENMKYLVQLRMSRPYFEFRPAQELVEDDNAVMAHLAAGRGENYAFVYTPLGLPFRVKLDKLGEDRVKASWFNPRNGEVRVYGVFPPEEVLFVPPASGKGFDWVLILDVLRQREITVEEAIEEGK
jgi:hypothetical protein